MEKLKQHAINEFSDQTSDSDTGDESESAAASFNVANEIVYRTEKSTSVVYIKKGTVVEADKVIPAQLRVVT